MMQSMCIAHFIVASSVTACVAFVLLSWVFEFVEYRKQRAQRQKDEPKPKQESETTSKEIEKPNRVDEEVKAESSGVSSSTPSIPCLDRLREELSCDICLEIFHEPSTTPCGHSFCKKCLSSAADRCGRKCPKCMEMISNGKCYKVNTVLWNTVQLLFPQEVEARKADTDNAAAASDIRAVEDLRSSSRGLWPQLARGGGYVTRPELPSPDRLREEFREAFTPPDDRRSSVAPASARV